MNDKEGQLIGLERPSKRRQLALPPLSSITGRGSTGRGLLDWQLELWGVRGHAVSLPFTVQAGGSRESCPRPRQPQVGFVVCHHGSCSTKLPLSPSIRETNNKQVAYLSMCVSTYFHMYMSASSKLCSYYYYKKRLFLCESSR